MSLECVVWCRGCGEDRYEVHRSRVSDQPGVFVNTMTPEPPGGITPTRCRKCGTVLERKAGDAPRARS